MHSPVFFISERDVLDKRIEFTYNNIYYCHTTSIDESFYPPVNNVIRCKTIINMYIIVSDEKYYYFMSFNQIDPKVKNYIKFI
jgi:hypothetical protein